MYEPYIVSPHKAQGSTHFYIFMFRSQFERLSAIAKTSEDLLHYEFFFIQMRVMCPARGIGLLKIFVY